MTLDLHRLRTYINERAKESKRLEHAAVHDSVRRAHSYSVLVGQQILREIDQASEESVTDAGE